LQDLGGNCYDQKECFLRKNAYQEDGEWRGDKSKVRDNSSLDMPRISSSDERSSHNKTNGNSSKVRDNNSLNMARCSSSKDRVNLNKGNGTSSKVRDNNKQI
jgi:hypothetical protein